MSRRFRFLSVASLLLGILFVTALASNGVRYRLRVVLHKATGSLHDVSWVDLFHILNPRSGVWLERLADEPNPYASIAGPQATAEDLARGQEIFSSRCAGCHAFDASGGVGPALVGRILKHGDSDWALYRVIRMGVPETAMSAQALSRGETWQVIAHLRRLSGADANPAQPLPQPPGGADYPPVTFERLKNAERSAGEDGWLTYSGSYNGQRFSPSDQIDRGNVTKLKVSWIRVIEDVGSEAVQATPLVNGATMFITAPPQRVIAVSARTGAIRWEYSRQVPTDLVRGYGTINRGVALFERLVFVGTLDAHLVALDAETGQVRWDVEVAPYRQGYTITGAPLAIDGLIITGISGGDYPIRGFIDAYDAATGQRRWRLYTIPEPGQPGSDTWSADSWRVGGAATWLTGSFDPESNRLLWGVGNPSPGYAGDMRPGDNLYSNSVVAIDAATGRLAWHFQFTPRDEYDWDSAQIPVLANLSAAGGLPNTLLWANRNGFFYALDGRSGAFQRGKPFVRQNWANGLDATGRPNRVPGSSPSAAGTLVYPHKHGGTSWWSPTFSPKTGWFYVPSFDGPMLFFRSGTPTPEVGQQFLGGSFQYVTGQPPIARVKALAPMSGDVVWEYRPASDEAKPVMGLMSTGGELVFAAHGTRIVALDAASGSQLWAFDTGQPVRAAPISFMVDGRQHVGVVAGALMLTFNLPIE